MKRICVVTGTRAEYGLLKELISEINGDKEVELQLIVTGMHLSPEFGFTYKEIERDGFFINDKIEILMSSDTDIGISKSTALALISFSETYNRLKPDIVILLGDRYEMLAAALAAYISKVPIVHLCGGDITEGAYDDAFRHSITKMAYLHFPTTMLAKKRIEQLGENPEKVFYCGYLGNDELNKLKCKDKKELEKIVNFNLDNYMLIVYHATTLEKENPALFFENMMTYLVENFKDYNFVIIKGNSDTYGRSINQRIDILENRYSTRIKGFFSLSREEYLNFLKNANIMIGNSSSGIYEAPCLKKLNINIGDRQKGRERASTTIDCPTDINRFIEVMEKYKNSEYLPLLEDIKNPYFGNDVAKKILSVIKDELNKGKIDLKKKFIDIFIK